MVVMAAAGIAAARARIQSAGIEMGAWEFLRRMLRVAGHRNIKPADLHARLDREAKDLLLVDLCTIDAYADGHIEGAVHKQFDDFLKAVVVEGSLDHRRSREVVLICGRRGRSQPDWGIAASIYPPCATGVLIRRRSQREEPRPTVGCHP
jgi:rhodanese-related sulfurtransferase